MTPTIMLTAAEKEIDSVHRSHLSAPVSVLSSKPFVYPRMFISFSIFWKNNAANFQGHGNGTRGETIRRLHLQFCVFLIKLTKAKLLLMSCASCVVVDASCGARSLSEPPPPLL